MKNREHILMIPVVFLLAIFLFPSFINLNRPIPLKSNFGSKQKIETRHTNEIGFYTDILIEEELIKDELVQEGVLKLDLLDYIIFNSKNLAIKTLLYNNLPLISIKQNFPCKFILQKISKWLI